MKTSKKFTKYNIIIDEPDYFLSCKTIEKIIRLVRKDGQTPEGIILTIDEEDEDE